MAVKTAWIRVEIYFLPFFLGSSALLICVSDMVTLGSMWPYLRQHSTAGNVHVCKALPPHSFKLTGEKLGQLVIVSDRKENESSGSAPAGRFRTGSL